LWVSKTPAASHRRPLHLRQAIEEVRATLGALERLRHTFCSLWGALGSFGPALGTLGVVLALFGSLWRPLGGFWGAFGWLWGSFGLPWGAFGLPLGRLGGHFGRLWPLLGACGTLLGVNNVKKSTFRTYAFYVGKTTYFVGLGGQVGAKMPPRRAQMTQNGRLIAQSWPKEAKDGAKRTRMRPQWAKMGPRRRIEADFGPTLATKVSRGRPGCCQTRTYIAPSEPFWKVKMTV